MGDISKENRQLLERITYEGKLRRLYKKDVKTEKEVDLWSEDFINSFDVRDIDVIQNHKIFWKNGDERSVEAPKYGVCAGFTQIKWLIDNERITRAMCGVDLADWQNMNKIMDFVYEEIPAGDGRDKVEATGALEKRALDKVVEFMTGKMYVHLTGPGQKAQKYFENYKDNVVAMERLHRKGVANFLDDLKENFAAGQFLTWKDAVNELKLHCGFEEEQHDIIDIFKRMKDIATKSAKEMPMRSKILKMKLEVEKWMIVESKEFIHGQDVNNEHAASRQTVKEEYNPIINTLFHCLIFSCGNLSEHKWRKATVEFYNNIAQKPTYKTWQRNRSHLYQLLDKNSVGVGMNSVEEKEEGGVEEQNAVNAKKKGQPSRGNNSNNNNNKGFSNNNFNRGNYGGSQNVRGNFRGGNRGLTSRNNFVPRRGQSSGNVRAIDRTVGGKRQCFHCTESARKPIYHDFPFQGGKMCYYDKSGKLKKGVRIVAMVESEGANQGGASYTATQSSFEGGQGYENLLNLPNYGIEQNYVQDEMDHRDGILHETPEGELIGAIHENGVFLDMNGNRAKGDEEDFERMKDEYGVTKMSTPILDCKFISPNKPNEYLHGRLTFDSGAANSMINAKALKYCQWKFAGPRVKKYIGAGGNDLPLWSKVVDVAVEIAQQGMIVLKRVLVAESEMVEQVLVGRTDMNRLKIKMDFETNRMKIGVSKDDTWFPMTTQKLNSIATVKSERVSANHSVASKYQFETLSKEDKGVMSVEQVYKEIYRWKSKEDQQDILSKHEAKSAICDHRDDGCDCDTWSTVAQMGEACMGVSEQCNGCEKCVSEYWSKLSEIEKEKPDIEHRTGVNAEQYLNAYIERIRQRDLNTNTSEDCTIDERIRRDDPELYGAIRALIKEYKDLFTGEIGCLGEKYKVKAEITGKLSSQRPGHQKFQGTTLVAVMKQFARQLAHGVIARVEDVGVIPKNHMQILPVSKKDDDGNIVQAISATRVVVNAQSTNAHTLYSGAQTDNLEDSVQFAARASEKGFNLKADISDAYYCIPMDIEMSPYFCFEVPFIGTCCYLKLVQGWAPAAQFCQNVMGRVFFPLWENLRRYMDDVILASFEDRKDYLKKLRQFFSLCRQSGLKLKGKKCYFCVQEFNYLGTRIEKGLIVPSKHYCSRIEDIAMESIKTKSGLKSYVMKIQYVARFLNRSTEMLKPLRDASNGDGKEAIIWNNELAMAFDRSKRALKELTVTYPFEPNLPTVLVVDTSLIATGGFLYQIGQKGARIISFFSRSRKDKERKCPLSSCHTETFGVVAGVTAFLPFLRQCTQTITIVVDSKPLVQAFQRFRNFQYSDDTRLNNALYQIRSLIDVNFVHAKNVNTKLCLADVISRLGNFEKDEGCVGAPSCTICKAADMDNRDRLSTIATVNEWVQKGKNHGNYIAGPYTGVNRDSFWFGIKKIEIPGHLMAIFARNQNHTIESFKKDVGKIRRAQESNGDFLRLFRDIPKGITSYAKKKARLQTLLVTRSAKIENGILTLEKQLPTGMTIRVIPLPDTIAMEAIAAVHKTIGHQSAHQIAQHMQRHFEVGKLKEKVERFVSKCVKCTLMRGGQSQRPKMAPVPLPKDMFTVILADEVHRTVRNKPLKYVIAMENLSTFITVVTFEGAMSGEKFVGIMAHIKSVLCPLNRDQVKIVLRCDQAKYHTSAMVQETLAMMNIELQVHHSTTMSKNCVPELDVKIRSFSKHQIQIFEDQPVTLEQSCHLAAAVCNNTIGHLGVAPAELFTGRGWGSDKTVQIDVQKVLNELASRREKRRNEDERRRLKQKQKVERKFIPYQDDELNSELVSNPNVIKIKIGDIVTLKQQFNKNEPKCAWRVLKVDFSKKKILAERNSGLDLHRSEPKWWSFIMIEEIFDEKNEVFELKRTELANKGMQLQIASQEEYNAFLRKCFFAMVATRSTSDVDREYMNLPSPLSDSTDSWERIHGEIQTEETCYMPIAWPTPKMHEIEVKKGEMNDETKIEPEVKTEVKPEVKAELDSEVKIEGKESWEEVSQEMLENSFEILRRLEEEQRPVPQTAFVRRSSRQSARTGQTPGAFDKYLKF